MWRETTMYQLQQCASLEFLQRSTNGIIVFTMFLIKHQLILCNHCNESNKTMAWKTIDWKTDKSVLHTYMHNEFNNHTMRRKLLYVDVMRNLRSYEANPYVHKLNMIIVWLFCLSYHTTISSSFALSLQCLYVWMCRTNNMKTKIAQLSVLNSKVDLIAHMLMYVLPNYTIINEINMKCENLKLYLIS